MISESKFWIADDFQLKTGSFLGIVSFSSGNMEEHHLTQILEEKDRDEQKTSIDDLTAGGGTEIGDALIYSARVKQNLYS